MRLLTLTAVVASSALLLACSDTPEPTDPAGYNGGYGAQAGYPQQPGQPGAYPQQPGQPGAYPQQPGAYPQQPGAYPQQPGPAPAPAPAPAGQSGGSATPVPPAAAMVAQPMLQGLAQQQVPGMKPEGSAFAGNFQPGQTLEQPIQIQPGRCYSVVAVGMGITELDVQLVLHQPPLPPQVLAQDNAQGSQAVLGGGGQCFKNALPIGGPGKVVVTARAGSGLAIAQVYTK